MAPEESTSEAPCRYERQHFPWKLHNMLEAAESRGDDSVVSWLPCNRAFKVHKRELFENGYMREFFNQTKYKSFQRQLNLWGFERITQDEPNSPNRGAYLHTLFVKGRKDLCNSMTRVKAKGVNAQVKEAKAIQGRNDAIGLTAGGTVDPAILSSIPASRRFSLPIHTPSSAPLAIDTSNTLQHLSSRRFSAPTSLQDPVSQLNIALGGSSLTAPASSAIDLMDQLIRREALRSQALESILLAEHGVRNEEAELKAILTLSAVRRASLLLGNNSLST